VSTLVGGPAPRAEIPRSPEVEWLYQNAILGETRRFRQIDRFQAFYLCTAYNRHELDWDGLSADQMETISPEIMVPYGYTQPAQDVKVRAKRPTAPSNICKATVERFTGLLFGESRRPEVIVEGDPDTEDWLAAVMEQCRFWAKWREARNMGGACGSVLVTVGVRKSRFAMEIHNPKHCQVVWRDRRTFEPAAVLICYRYPVEEPVFDPKTREVIGTQLVEYLKRRIISENEDIVFKDAKLAPDEGPPPWIVESEVHHGLGFFPGVWIQNMPVIEEEDGDPDCQGAWQSIDTYDRMLAQMNKGALLNLDPTPVIKTDPKEVMALADVQKGSEHALYVGANGDAKYMEISGSGIEVGEKILGVLEQNISKVTRCVFLDPEKLSGAAQSGKAMEYIFAQMIEKADDLRAQYGDLGVVPVLVIIEKIARKLQGASVELPAAEDGTRRIGVFKIELPPRRDGKPQKLGPGGYIRIKWGPYFSATENDKEITIRNAAAAKSAGLVDLETAVKGIAPIYEVRDVQGMMKKITAEQDEEMQRQLGPVEDAAPPPPAEKPAASPFRAPSLTQQAIASILKVNEARAMVQLGPLLDPDGNPDPEGFLTVVEYQARHAGQVATAAKAEAGEGEDEEQHPADGAPPPASGGDDGGQV